MGIFFIILGIFILVATILKLPFYWNSRKALRARRLLGDTITYFLYLGIGIMIEVIGILYVTGKLN